MATQFHLEIVGTDVEEAAYAAMLCFRKIDELELLLSRFVPDSDISRINRMESGDELMLEYETWHILKKAIKIEEETQGAFQLGVGEYMDIFRATKQGILSHFDMTRALTVALQDAENSRIYVDPKSPKIYCLKQGLKLDLGAIGKGFALDQLALLLEELEISNYAINVGNSSVLVKGGTVENDYWGFSLSTSKEEIPLQLKNTSVSASGTFYQGQHIFDPRTGQNNFQSLYDRIWVASKSAAISDAYSTACFLLEKEFLTKTVQEHSKVDWIAISRGGKIEFIGKNRVPLNLPEA